ncbi:MAG: divalent-cation tolerance protein CutA [Methanoregula sp.]|jgi:periplasmic divalent cation tolerance protein|nr:divalent-cation tolerance protein CutA [Methanoregula sp.]
MEKKRETRDCPEPGHDPDTGNRQEPEWNAETPGQECVVMFCTAPATASEPIARMLIDRRLVACVNVQPVQSYYRWQGEFCNDAEHLLIMKTTREKAVDVIAAIRAAHSYEIPEIIVLPIIAGYTPYLSWVVQETQG